MEYEKNGEKFSFGFGSTKTAGAGNLKVSEEVPKSVRTKYNKKDIAVTAAKAVALTGLVLLKRKIKKKK